MTLRIGLGNRFMALLALWVALACDAPSRSFAELADASRNAAPTDTDLVEGQGDAGTDLQPQPSVTSTEPSPPAPEPVPDAAAPEPLTPEPTSEPEVLLLDASVEPEPLVEPEPDTATSGPDGGPPVCPPSDGCRDFGADAVSGCGEAGTCPAAGGCPFVWTEAALDGAACECSDQGCGFVLASPCGSDDACTSGACVPTASNESVCCDQRCDEDEVCTSDGTFCEPAAECLDGEVRCSATAAYQECVAGQWTTVEECGALGCSTGLMGCLRSAGQSCTATAQCGEGVCRTSSSGTSICCTASCDSPCRRCAPSGTSCQSLTDDDACGTVQCPVDTTCRDYAATVTGNRCVAGACGTPAELCGFMPRNSGQPCDANNLCSSGGDCSIPKKSLGATCTTGVECVSGNCADGRCCDGPCGAVCETCNSSGQCVATADDTACTNVTCAADTQCRDYAASITSNRCASRGTCKTAADCPYTDAPAGTACGVAEQCDGMGTCPPRIVPCGATSCPVNPGVCCWYRDLDQAVCETGSTCPAIGSTTGRAVFCSSSLQCPNAEICCNYSNPNGSAVDCLASCDPASVAVAHAPICQLGNPSGAPCPEGLTCGAQTSENVPPGYDRCEYP